MVELEIEILSTQCSNPALFELVTMLTLTYLKVSLSSEKDDPGSARI